MGRYCAIITSLHSPFRVAYFTLINMNSSTLYSLPSSMRHIDHGGGGTASVMRVVDGALPTPRAGEVLIEVIWAGVNRPDVLQRSGAYPPPPGASPHLGLEVSGRIVALGEGVNNVALGQEVCALTPGGGYAEYCVAPALHCLPIPKGLSLREAAAIPENYFTVWSNVFERGGLKSGQQFLVHGGSSGIGLTAIQLAKEKGAIVYTTVGNEDKVEAVKKYGVAAAINYRTQDWVQEIARLTDKKGVDCILDMVGGAYIAGNLRSLAIDGTLIQIAFLQGSKVELDCMPIMIKRLHFTGSTLRPQSVESKARIAMALREHVLPLLKQGRALPLIHTEYPLEEAASAHLLMESSAHIGKIMLRVR